MARNTEKNNIYKQHLGLTLTEIGSLIGISKEAVRLKLMNTNRWRQVAQSRKKTITELEQEIEILRSENRLLKLKAFEHTQKSPQQMYDEEGYRYIINHSVRCQKLFERLGITNLSAVRGYGITALGNEPSIGAGTLNIIKRGIEMGKIEDIKETAQ